MNNYSILGLKKGATTVEIKTQFRCLSKQLHPDVNGGDKNKTDRFLVVLAAYQELLDGKTGEIETSFYKEKKKEDTISSYQFTGVKIEKNKYVFSMFLYNVERVEISTSNGRVIGEYNTKGVTGDVNLSLEKSLLEGTDYLVRVRLIGSDGGHAVKGYKFKKPSYLSKLINKIF
jgi:DnaJ-class molecular chaperone